jgi:hypothetical protein
MVEYFNFFENFSAFVLTLSSKADIYSAEKCGICSCMQLRIINEMMNNSQKGGSKGMTSIISRLRMLSFAGIYDAHGTRVPGCSPTTVLSGYYRGFWQPPEEFTT